jgi:hypothetical protein
MAEIPKWSVQGDWFDTCKCAIPCPCYFAQPPTHGDCDGILAWHIREGKYGQVLLDGLNVMAVGAFEGNIWEGKTKASMGIFLDERADERQREALQMIFGGRAGGWPGVFANFIGGYAGSSSLISSSPSPMTSRAGEPRFLGSCSLAAKPLPARPRSQGSASRCTIRPARKSVQERLPLKARRRRTMPRLLVLSGSGPAVRASTWGSVGPGPTRRDLISTRIPARRNSPYSQHVSIRRSVQCPPLLKPKSELPIA